MVEGDTAFAHTHTHIRPLLLLILLFLLAAGYFPRSEEKKKKNLRSVWRTTWRKERYRKNNRKREKRRKDARCRRQRVPCYARKNTAGRSAASGAKTLDNCDSSRGRTEAMRAEAARPERAALPAFSTLATKASLAAEQRTVVLFYFVCCGERKGSRRAWRKGVSLSRMCALVMCHAFPRCTPASPPDTHRGTIDGRRRRRAIGRTVRFSQKKVPIAMGKKKTTTPPRTSASLSMAEMLHFYFFPR